MRVLRSVSIDTKVIPGDVWDGFCGGSVSRHFVNNIGKTVYVLDRNGLIMRVNPSNLPAGSKARADGAFNIGVRYNVPVASMEMVNVERVHYGTYSPFTPDATDQYAFQWYSISREEITRSNVVHDLTHDVYVSLYPEALRAMANSIRDRESPLKAKASKRSGLNLTLCVVNNNADAPEAYYVNVLGRVFKVPVSKSTRVEDGVWIDSNILAVGEDSIGFQSLEDSVYSPKRTAVPVMVTLFLNADEARQHGNVDSELKEKLKLQEEQQRLREMELTKLKHDLEQLKQAAAKEKHEHEQELQRLKTQLDIKSMDRKDSYEERSQKRKDTSDGWATIAKFLGAVATVAGAAVALWRLL